MGQGQEKTAEDCLTDAAKYGKWIMLQNVHLMITWMKGFERKLEINGVGYKASTQGNKAVFNLGFSHTIELPFPEGVTIAVDKNTLVTVSGIDKEKVGQCASEIRGYRPPDAYKGKGVRYQGEYVRLKTGKSA